MRSVLSTAAVAFVLLAPFGRAEISALPKAADGFRDSAAAFPQNGDADNAKRIAEIQKEIAELQARIAKLTAELAKLQPAGKAAKPDTSNWARITGTITELSGAKGHPDEFYLGKQVCVGLGPKTQFLFSDNTKASIADLKVGQSVRASVLFVSATKSKPPILIYDCDLVIIEKVKGP